jgi:hypothetical protein
MGETVMQKPLLASYRGFEIFVASKEIGDGRCYISSVIQPVTAEAHGAWQSYSNTLSNSLFLGDVELGLAHELNDCRNLIDVLFDKSTPTYRFQNPD